MHTIFQNNAVPPASQVDSYVRAQKIKKRVTEVGDERSAHGRERRLPPQLSPECGLDPRVVFVPEDDRFLGLEVAVDRGRRDADLGGDLGDRHLVEAARLEHVERGSLGLPHGSVTVAFAK